MDLGSNEWLEDIQRQTKRLAGLTNDLVYLSRMEEEEKDMQMISLTGNEKAIRQLINILMDNALKYSLEQGQISVDVQKQGKYIVLTVFNTTQIPIPGEKLDILFERFYRMDASRSTMTGGYGIGLSVARAIVNAHNGKIYATSDGEYSIKITACLPF